jgi:predicted O-linked N-acetylglucosamine transferase (SPINDLY family)
MVLDTHIYGGGVTTTNALWAGVPVITLCGKHYLSRMSTSMLKSVGLPELITNNLKEYENLAVNLANNPTKLTSIRSKLNINRTQKPLFNSILFTKNFEAGLEKVWNNHLLGITKDIII